MYFLHLDILICNIYYITNCKIICCFINRNRIGSILNDEEKKYEIFSLCQRFKAKYVTLKFFAFRKTSESEEKKN